MHDTPGYRIFSTKFDREVSASALDDVLGPLSAPHGNEQNLAFAEFAEARATRAHTASALFSGVVGADTAVTLLLDQSGSMRGRPMALAAAAIAQAVDQLTSVGCAVEVLGFTTASWRGGRPRRQWKWRFRPRNPGRLCELLHVIYRDGGETSGNLSDETARSMLRPDLPKENVDGEAVLWAADRLRARPEPNRLLVILSDGSPVDDSTQQANGPYFLDAHLKFVLETLQQEGLIRVSAVGIGYDVGGWYPDSISVKSVDDLGGQLSDFLAGQLRSLATPHPH